MQKIIIYYQLDKNKCFSGEVAKHSDSLKYVIKLTGAVLGPIALLGVIGAIVLIFMRRVHKKRLLQQRIKLDPETYYASDDLLRATSAGDSTLRVILIKQTNNPVLLTIKTL